MTTKKDGLCYWDTLPRLPLSQQTSSQSDNQWQEILFWQIELGADPILQDCLINHQLHEYVGDKNHCHDLALKRAEQLWETKQEIERFGHVVTRDFRVFGNKKYADYQASVAQNANDSKKCTYGLNLTPKRSRNDQRLQDLESMGWLVQFNSKMKNKAFDTKMMQLFSAAGTSDFLRIYNNLKDVYNAFQKSLKLHGSASLDNILDGKNYGTRSEIQRQNCKDVPNKMAYSHD